MIITENSIKQIISESGIQNINKLAKRYKKAKIYFHQDLDGVTTAIAMKAYLEKYGIKTVDAEIIQYGDKEFSIKKPDASGEVMPVLVDFAHGKPMFVIHTDHHDSQVGVEKGTSTSFRHSRSNVETISQVLSPQDIFPSSDIMMISTVDSADYARLGITPDDVMNYIFKLDKTKEFVNNKIAMALVTNKLLLAYKNKPKFLERLVLDSTPSLLNIYLNIVKLAKEDGYASAVEMKQNLGDYIQKQSENSNVEYDEEYGIISQYGGGSMFKPGSYDRYVPFKLYPDANFFVIAWPLGLLQASCNPFKANRELKGVDLGKMKDVVLDKFKNELYNKILTFDTIKYFAEKNKDFTEDSVGFDYNALLSIYGTDSDIAFNDMLDYEDDNNFNRASRALEDQINFTKNSISKLFNKKYLDLTSITTDEELSKKYKVISDYYEKGDYDLAINKIKSVITEKTYDDLNFLTKLILYTINFNEILLYGKEKGSEEVHTLRKNKFFELKNNFLNFLSKTDINGKNFFGGINGLTTTPKGSPEGYTVNRWVKALKKVLDKPYSELNQREIKALKTITITGWDMIKSNSGGHKCITNISGLMYFGKDGVSFLKKFSEEFINQLKSKIDSSK